MSLTCVSGYWNVKNKHDEKYFKWFENSLKINNPYIFFSNDEGIEMIKSFRGDLPTHYVKLDVNDFHMQKYADRILIHEQHCPSVELNMIWNEKIFLMEKARELNIYNTEYFMWIDAGICRYRNLAPPTDKFDTQKIKDLPRDKFIYSSSHEYDDNEVRKQNYYHHVSGTSYILHKSIIPTFVKVYDKYLEELMNKDNIWTDQLILTHIYKNNKDIFYKFSDGYGYNVNNLY